MFWRENDIERSWGIPVDEQHFFLAGRAMNGWHGDNMFEQFLIQNVGKEEWDHEEMPTIDLVWVRCSCEKCVPWRDSNG